MGTAAALNIQKPSSEATIHSRAANPEASLEIRSAVAGIINPEEVEEETHIGRSLKGSTTIEVEMMTVAEVHKALGITEQTAALGLIATTDWMQI